MTEEFQGRMPAQLREFWIHGEGAGRIRWGTEGAFGRCVRELSTESAENGHPIADPEGTCANLYHAATGKWPGAHRGEMGIEEDLEALVASMGDYQPVRWRGPLAPISRPTDDRRMFPPDTLTFQSMPAPYRFAREQKSGHEGAVTVGRILATQEYTDEDGEPWVWGWGDFLNPDIIPEVKEVLELAEGGVVYPSVDLVSYSARMAEYAGEPVTIATKGKVRAVTLVAISAFSDLRPELAYPDDEDYDEFDPFEGDDVEVDPGDAEDEGPQAPEGAMRPFDLAPAETFTVNSTGWANAPIAPRDAEFDADDAVKRIQAWAGLGTDAPDVNKLASVFLWVNTENKPLLGTEGYRLPWGDIIDGKPYLIYHAIYAASALLEGGHGGLPNIPDADKARLRSVITDIYAKLAKEFGDPNIRASWDSPQTASAAAIETEQFLGKYTEAKHPRDPRGTDEGGEWRDVPGHGPHGQIKLGGKWVYPKRRRTKDYQPKRAAPSNPDHEGKHRAEGESTGKKSYKPKRALKYRYHGTRRAEDARKAEREKETKAPETKAVAKKAPAKKAAEPKKPEPKTPETKAPAKKTVAKKVVAKREPKKKVEPKKVDFFPFKPKGSDRSDTYVKTVSLKNPKVLNDSNVSDGRWWDSIPDDTTADGIPVRGLTIQKYQVENGTVYKRNGIAYLIESDTGRPDQRTVDEFEDFHNSLPEGGDAYQRSYAWLWGRNPADAQWAVRYNTNGFRSQATGGNSSVTMWGNRPGGLGPSSYRGSLAHEFGHNVSYSALGMALGSTSPRWKAAYKEDTEANAPFLKNLDAVKYQGEAALRKVTARKDPGKSHPEGITPYGKSNPEEDYAESMSMFLMGQIGTYTLPSGQEIPVYFRDIFPHRAEILDKVFPKVAAKQRAIMDKRGPIAGLGG